MTAYTNAGEVLPRHLLEAVQNYIDGEYLYIPRRRENRKSWGETTNARQIMEDRNAAMYEQYRCGLSVHDLASMYCLSTKAVYKVLAARRQA